MGIDFTGNCSATTRSGIKYIMRRTPESADDTDFHESWAPNVVNASFIAQVPWDDADQFVLDMIGEHRQQKVGNRAIRRYNPEQHPYNPNLYCVGCELVRNLGAESYDTSANNAIAFEYTEYKCTFAAFIYDIVGDATLELDTRGELLRYVERRSKQVGQSIQTNGLFEYVTPNPQTRNATAWVGTVTYQKGDYVARGGSVYQSNAANNLNNAPPGATWDLVDDALDAILTPPAIMLPYRQVQLIWHYVPGPLDKLWQTSDSYYGTLNAGPFDSSRYDVGTLMYVGMEPERIPSTPAGNELWRVTHNFNYFRKGWNTVYRPNVQGTAATDQPWFDGVRNRATKDPPYDSQNFANLFVLQ